MTAPGRDLDALIDAARSGDDPSTEDRARISDKLALRLGVGAGFTGEAPPIQLDPAGAAQPDHGGGSALGFGAAIAVVVAVLLSLGWLANNAPPSGLAPAERGADPRPEAHAAVRVAVPPAGFAASAPDLGSGSGPSHPLAPSANGQQRPGARVAVRGDALADEGRTSREPAARARGPAHGRSARTAAPPRAVEAESNAAGAAPARTQVAALPRATASDTPMDEAATTDPFSEPRRQSSEAARAPEVRSAEGETTAPRQADPIKPLPELETELALLEAARAALRAHRPARTLELVQHHAYRFPASAFIPERLALKALALCGQRRYDAGAQTLRILQERVPDSPLLAGVRSACRTAAGR